ncbi:2-amino-4-hydroxy-6-hydroxymethyldihydropteridine diphosphokinase [Pseudomarimonas arenosa]|uniref:2-amino-4-hydroxy-6-hydroxymethyldihydropteridine pyrophosphokinase n=1 Tax=Pseudomarimonas arenosa TaxID=2774145 RepID=A0AAW3ZM26_9GAMM|nr:2-amino-4-hydroxy-6-hydroxymethyldihydropteridine diphosphokinase [Pseudomarimonas arenosa]MBD8525704.1 2-amino-4-hydroxy-6-hydroxymethyldihydropteridine diphosphokinase [Pseudomarimonas arenosa]
MTEVLLSLGSNIEPKRHLDLAVAELRQQFPGLRVSGYYRTVAVGFDGEDFLNAAVAIDTEMPALQLNAWLHALEDRHGRRRDGPRFSSRTLDIDIVYYGDQVLSGPHNLQIPREDVRHAFVLAPLAEIAPDFVDPERRLTLAAMWQQHPAFETVLPQCANSA